MAESAAHRRWKAYIEHINRMDWYRHRRHLDSWPVAGCAVCEDAAAPDPLRPSPKDG